jgi:formylmethanofuran dehydrogenase subunit B
VALTQDSMVCSGCGCLCDDLDISLQDGRIVEVNNVCLWGAAKFFDAPRFHPQKKRHRLRQPQIRTGRRWEQATSEAALAEAAGLLSRARRPVIYGLTNSGSRAQEAALALARRLQARLEPADLAFKLPYYQSVQQHGLFWAPLEVIRDEADTVLFWGANPLHSCPRHVVRYSVFARGRFTERGVEDRRAAAVDLYRTELAKFCHLFVKTAPGQELALLQGVLALLAGREVPDRVKGTKRLADFLAQGEYCVIFCGRGISYGPAAEMFDGLARLAALLNERGRGVLFPLSAEFNSVGLWHLLLRELGRPGAPEFGPGGEVRMHQAPLDLREADALLVTGADILWHLPEAQVQDLKRREVPIVVLSPFANRTTAQARVVLPSALAGVETAEVAYRMDGLPVALRAVTPARAPADYEVLEDLHRLLYPG